MATEQPATSSAEPDAARLSELILSSRCPHTLDLPEAVSISEAKTTLASSGTDNAWRAYDLLHQLQTFGRAF